MGKLLLRCVCSVAVCPVCAKLRIKMSTRLLLLRDNHPWRRSALYWVSFYCSAAKHTETCCDTRLQHVTPSNTPKYLVYRSLPVYPSLYSPKFINLPKVQRTNFSPLWNYLLNCQFTDSHSRKHFHYQPIYLLINLPLCTNLHKIPLSGSWPFCSWFLKPQHPVAVHCRVHTIFLMAIVQMDLG